MVGGLSFGRPSIPIVSNVTGGLASDDELCSVGYWVRHVREPVRFMDGVRCCVGVGWEAFCGGWAGRCVERDGAGVCSRVGRGWSRAGEGGALVLRLVRLPLVRAGGAGGGVRCSCRCCVR